FSAETRITLFSPAANYLGIHHRDLVCGETPTRARAHARSKWQLARISGAARYMETSRVAIRCRIYRRMTLEDSSPRSTLTHPHGFGEKIMNVALAGYVGPACRKVKPHSGSSLTPRRP
ncbi:hypothetical protein ALC62_01477, partial [Cyphomyrmex costatus]